MTLTELADRVSRVTGPCRETDILIGYAVDLRGDDTHLTFRRSFDVCGMEKMLQMAESHQNIWRHELPRYTASLDAAMTLVPEGWFVTVCQHLDHWRVKLNNPDALKTCSGKAANEVQARLAAILRARAALENSHG